MMYTAMPAAGRRALAIDVDPPFQHVLATWLEARSFAVAFVALAQEAPVPPPVDLIVCELAEPKLTGARILGELAQSYPGAVRLAISARFVAGARWDALARQLGADAALAKPFSRDEFNAALDAAFRARPPAPR